MAAFFQPGDFLVFQLEAGYALLRVLRIDDGDEIIWHIATFADFFLDVEHAEGAIAAGQVKPSEKHLALSNRAFESTQVARLVNRPLSTVDLAPLVLWNGEVEDRSIRLLLGLR